MEAQFVAGSFWQFLHIPFSICMGAGLCLGSLLPTVALELGTAMLMLPSMILDLLTWKGEDSKRVDVCKWICRPSIYLYCQGNGAERLSHPDQEGCTWHLWWSEFTQAQGHCYKCQALLSTLHLCPLLAILNANTFRTSTALARGFCDHFHLFCL